MTDVRPLTFSDLWLPGNVLGGAVLAGWSGPVFHRYDDVPYCAGVRLHIESTGKGRMFSLDPRDCRFGPFEAPRLNCLRPEVRDRILRVVGPELLPVHTAEIRGNITSGEAAGLMWCNVLRRDAGLPIVQGWLSCWKAMGTADDGPGTRRVECHHRTGDATAEVGWCYQYRHSYHLGWRLHDGASGPELDEAGRAAADAAALAAGYALREPGGILLLPLPDGTGRLDTSA